MRFSRRSNFISAMEPPSPIPFLVFQGCGAALCRRLVPPASSLFEFEAAVSSHDAAVVIGCDFDVRPGGRIQPGKSATAGQGGSSQFLFWILGCFAPQGRWRELVSTLFYVINL